jgi:hypothetical protein
MKVNFKWDNEAIEREVQKNLEARVAKVRCPVHGTRVTFDPHGQPAQTELCCDELTTAIRRALA